MKAFTPRGNSNVLPFPERQSPTPSRAVPSPIRVVIVDDHALVRQGIREFLTLDGDIDVVGDAADGRSGATLVASLKPDVVLMDVNMPEMGGIAATALIRREAPATAVVALSSATDAESVRGMISAGAVGYLTKATSVTDLCQAVRGAALGKVQLAPEAAAIIMRKMLEPDVDQLTLRENEVLQLLAEGKTNKAIGNSLFVGEKTVKTHVSNILVKLGVESRTQAALIAVERGLFFPSDAANAS